VDAADRQLLEQCMARMAAGDAAFLFTFTRRFAPHVARAVRRHLEEMGRRDVIADADEFEAIVLDACYVIYERAAGWKPGRALPWTWAARAIRAEVARAIGHRTVVGDEGDFDDETTGGHSTDGDLGVEDFSALARRHPDVALLADAVACVGTARDQRVFVEYRIQRALGDPSPAHVVAREFGLTPANVRQIDCRMRKRLAAVVASTPRFERLREVRWFAA
jgi:hypothetical protein